MGEQRAALAAEKDRLRTGLEYLVRDVRETVQMSLERGHDGEINGPYLLARLDELLSTRGGDDPDRDGESDVRYRVTLIESDSWSGQSSWTEDFDTYEQAKQRVASVNAENISPIAPSYYVKAKKKIEAVRVPASPPAARCMDCGHGGPSNDGDCDRCGGPAMPATPPAPTGGDR